MRRYHDQNIQERSFNVGDMVLRRIQDKTGLHKFNSRWEGPFIVSKVIGPSSINISGWSRGSQLMEYRAPTKVLPLIQYLNDICFASLYNKVLYFSSESTTFIWSAIQSA